MTRSLFISATGTGVGKTFVARGLASALHARGTRTVALKPIETGVTLPLPDSSDAVRIARACGMPALAHAPGLYRATRPLAPYAATLAGEPPPPELAKLAATVRSLSGKAEALLIEGAGGLLVPYDRMHNVSSLVGMLEMPLLLVAPNALGVLSHVLTAVESVLFRELTLAGVVLVDHPSGSADPSRAHNARILAERMTTPVLSFPACADDDAALAEGARSSGLVDLFDRIAKKG